MGGHFLNDESATREAGDATNLSLPTPIQRWKIVLCGSTIFPERAKDATPERLAQTLERGNKALGVMNQHLERNAFFAGNSYSVADIALYAYTHTAEMGGFQLDAYPAVAAWLKRVEADKGHVPIEWVG